MPTVEFRILGPLEVVCDETQVDLGAPLQRSVLAALVVRAGQVVPTERLCEQVWGGDPPPSARHSLQVYVSNLRRVLDQHLDELAADEVVVTRQPGYTLAVPDDWVDAARFERLLGEGRRALREGRSQSAAERLRRALDLWRGPALADLRDRPFAEAEARRLAELRLAGLEERIDADLELGRHEELTGELQSLVADHPLRERLRGQLMMALYGAGRRSEALRAYHEGRELLVEQLGVEPGEALQRQHTAILRQDPALLPEQPPEQQAATGPPGNLPAPLTSFVGRSRELAQVAGLLEASRLVTLTGAGGVGKTRLALEVARTRTHEFADGVWLVELGSVSDPELVPKAVAQAMEVREHSERAVTDQLVAELVNLDVLVVLDNCEHLLEAVARMLRRLLRACPRLRVLATSRQRLDMPGEALYPVGGLELPEHEPDDQRAVAVTGAARLLVDRLASVDPEFGLDATAAEAVVRICRRLDGLPLALELAAARANALGVAQIAAGLDDRFCLLTGADHTRPARHRTLRTVIDWSYELLEEPEQRLFARLGVFAGGFTLEAAGALWAPEGSAAVIELVPRLVDKSLVVAEHADGSLRRFRLLETLRTYARARLEEGGESEQAHAEFARYHLGWAEPAYEGLRGAEQLSWLDRLTTEHDNLRAVLGWLWQRDRTEEARRLAVALYRFWVIRGHYSEGRRWLERLAGTEGVGTARLRARTLLALATIAAAQGDYSRAMEAGEQAADLSREAGAHPELAYALQYQGLGATHVGELPLAEELLAESLEVARDAGARWEEGLTLVMLAGLALADEDYEAAAGLASGGAAVVRRVGDPHVLAWAQAARGAAAWGRQMPGQAATSLRHALEIFESLGGVWGLSLCLIVAARLAGMRESWRQAGLLLGAAEVLHSRVGVEVFPFMQDWREEALSRARTALGPAALEQAQAGGRELDPVSAVEVAIRQLDGFCPEEPDDGRNQPTIDLTETGAQAGGRSPPPR